MLFKITKEQAKIAITTLTSQKEKKMAWLKKQKPITPDTSKELKNSIADAVTEITKYTALLEELNFAVYKTKVQEFYLTYNDAKLVRPALLREPKKEEK